MKLGLATATAAAALSAARAKPALPREHGFWVMLGAAVCAALARAHFALEALGTAAVVVLVSAWAAGLASRWVRRHEALQLTSAAALSVAAVLVELAVRATRPCALAILLSWAAAVALFLSGNLHHGRLAPLALSFG